jgi:rhodanese-related sulfurtransferase/Fe-S cluster assembly iron-binding protein IscA
VHGFHVHEKGDCSALDASSAGAHYNPANAAHGNPASPAHHAGDIPNIQADASGRASVDALIEGVSLGGANDIVTVANGLELRFDVASAQRARGASIDWTRTPHGEGLAIHLPTAPQAIKPIDVRALKQRVDAGTITVIDVRPPADRARAPFAGAEVFEPETHERLTGLPKDTPLAFICHHGNSSRNAAEHFREHGFVDLYNVEGGIDAWSQEVDPSVERY